MEIWSKITHSQSPWIRLTSNNKNLLVFGEEPGGRLGPHLARENFGKIE